MATRDRDERPHRSVPRGRPRAALVSSEMRHLSTRHGPARSPVTKAGTALTTAELHSILHLRMAVFVVEQDCPYQEADGFDLRADTWHRWWTDGEKGTEEGTTELGSEIVAYLRVLSEPDRFRIGRVVTRADRRGRGLSAALVADTVQWLAERQDAARESVVLAAQSHLVGFYREHGFAATGSEFTEDGIPHVPMTRPLIAGTIPPHGGR